MATRHSPVRATLVVTALALAAACSSGGDDASPQNSRAPGDVTLTLLAHESFTPPADAFDAFTADTGIRVEIAVSGDAGELVSKAALTAGNPEGDVLWGVDNTLLGRALDADVFDPYRSAGLGELRPELVATATGAAADSAEPVVTPVDFGDVCVNYDVSALGELGVDPPRSFDDLTTPAYRGMLVVENPSTSSPGLAFLLATVAEFGDAWPQYWKDLRANDVLVVDGWEQAYYGSFTRAGGDRPLVVSYGSSPPAEVIFSDPPLPDDAPAPTAVAADTCFRQIEYAGILRGTDHPDEAGRLIDYLISDAFQSTLPESQFVYPANASTALPDVFVRYSVVPEAPLTLSGAEIAAGRQDWIDEWTNVVLR